MRLTRTRNLGAAMAAATVVTGFLFPATASAAGNSANSNGRAGSELSIYVTGQGLVYDSIVKTELPPNGPFQKLEVGGPTGLQTEFGPGDPGHHGGRWWLDANGDGEMNEGDAFFMCPLLGPGQPVE